MWSLPNILRRYSVGSTTFAAPVGTNPNGIVIGDAKLKELTASGGKLHAPALVLQEVAFTAFYPADTSQTSDGRKPQMGMPWLTNPAKEMLRGYSKFTGSSFFVLYWLLGSVASRIRIPVYLNAHLLNPSHASEGTRKSWPLVIFSHGLGGTGTNYSHTCARLASQGNVVLAIEHRDGSSPFVMARSPVPEGDSSFIPEYKYYLRPEDVYWENQAISDEDKFALRTEQLIFRRLEIYLAYTRFKGLVQGRSTALSKQLPSGEIHAVDGPWSSNLDERQQDATFWRSWMAGGDASPEDMSPKVQCDRDVHLTGHSFGGATVLSILSQSPPSLSGLEFGSLPVTHAIALDPWLDPLPSPVPAPWQVEASLDNNPRAIPKLLLLNSEGFTLWEDHFARLKDLVDIWRKPRADTRDKKSDEWGVSLISLIRAKHTSFSDAGILFPWGQNARDSQRFLDLIADLSGTFLRSSEDFARTLKTMRVRGEEIEKIEVGNKDTATKWNKKFVGEVGDIIIHV